MVRRLLTIVAIGFALSACGGAGSESIAVGSESISRDDLAGYSRTFFHLLGAGEAGFADNVAPAEPVREAAGAWIFFSSITQVLEESGEFVATDADRDAAGQQLNDFLFDFGAQIDDPFVLGFTDTSPGYEDIIDFVMVSNLINTNGAAIDAAQNAPERFALLETVEVEPRLGVWDLGEELVRPPGFEG